MTVSLEPTGGLLRSVLHEKAFCPTLLREVERAREDIDSVM